MSIIRNIISALFILCVCSCAADYTLHYSNVTFGDFKDGKFISDQGLTFNIVEQTCSGSIDSLKRAVISCDILANTGESEYSVRLTDFDPIFTKSHVDSTAVTDSSIFVNDPVNIGEIWYSGGYLNLLLYIPIKESSNQVHMVNLIRDDDCTDTGVYKFTFKHNAFGEVITATDNEFIFSSQYISFPLANIFQKNEQNVQIIFNWTSPEEKDGLLTTETKKNTVSLDVERSGYEHLGQE